MRVALGSGLLCIHGLLAQPAQMENLDLPNWTGDDYAPFVSPSGEYLIFQSDRPGTFEGQNLWFARNRLYRQRDQAADWSIPIPLFLPLDARATPTMRVAPTAGTLNDPPGTFSVNSAAFEGMAAFVFRNGQPVELYFTSSRHPGSGRPGYQGLNIYFSRYRDRRWSEPAHLNIINSDFDDRMAFVSNDGRSMFFVSNRPGGFGGNDIWYTERDLSTGLWAKPVNAGPAINTRYHEIAPTLSPDGSILFFSSDRPGGLGNHDLYYSRRIDFDWEAPRNLGEPFNSARDDEYVSFTADGMWAYIASDRRDLIAHGGFDLYRTRVPEWLLSTVEVLFAGQILDATTRNQLPVAATIRILYERETIVRTSNPTRTVEGGAPENFSIRLRSGREYRVVITAPGYYPNELRLSYSGTVQPGSVDRRVTYMRPVQETATSVESELRRIPGRLVDDSSGAGLPEGTVLFLGEGGAGVPLRVEAEGRFSVDVALDSEFRLRGSAPGYEDRVVSFRESEELTELIVRLEARPEEQGPCTRVECLSEVLFLFDTDSSELRADSSEKLDSVVRILNAHPDLRVRLEGHADTRYTPAYNRRLSEARARSVRDALIARGLGAARFEVTGLGAPAVPEQSEAERQRNRRVDIRPIEEEP